MKCYRLLFIIGAFFCFFSVDTSGQSFEVRVLLERISDLDKSDTCACVVSMKNGAYITQVADTSSGVFKADDVFAATVSEDTLYINGRQVALDAVRITPKNKSFVYKEHEYPGACILAARDNSLYVINVLDLEDYVARVVQSESWPTWELEYLKTQAVVSRTYLVNKILEARNTKKKRGPDVYDICCTNKHQTYKGGVVRTTVQQAVDQTRGEVVVDKNGHPIAALYDTCCYRKKITGRLGIDFAKAPYLERDYACTFCAHAKCAQWKAEFSLDEFNALLSEHFSKHIKITDIKLSKRDPSGVVHDVKVKTRKGWLTIKAKNLYALGKKKIKSLCFKVKKRGSSIVFEGDGYGHGLGLCQWGAEHAARVLHWDYRRIVRFYYKNVSFKKIVVEESK